MSSLPVLNPKCGEVTLSNEKATEAARQPSQKPVLNGVNALIRSLSLDEAGTARAEVARVMARRLDDRTTGATSVALLSRELRSILAEMIDPDSQKAAADLIKSIFSDQ